MEPNVGLPGWYPDPSPGAPQGQRRYWTGKFWTMAVAAPEPPSGRGSGRRHRGRVALIGVAVVALVAVGGYFVTRSTKSYPKQWDAQVRPIAEQVEDLRGLTFKHPVPVRYLPDAELRRRVGVESSELSPEARGQLEDFSGTLRAFGLIDAQTDIVKSLNTVNQAGVLAYYDPDAEEIIVRGVGPLDILRKATLAHELTHVLQDQYFDLDAKRSEAQDSEVSSTGALKALIEGDAERIKLIYLRSLPDADRAAYVAAEAKSNGAVGQEVTGAAEIVKIELGAPYLFGPDVLNVIATQGGNEAIDDAMRRESPTDAIFLNPTVALADPEVASVLTPSLERNESQIGEPDHIGAFDLFTVLASRLDRQVALDAADTWTGDSYVTYRANDEVCVRATIASTTPAGAGTLAAALSQWAVAMPGAQVTTDLGHRRSTLTSCATSAVRAPDPAKLEAAMMLLGARNNLLAVLLGQDLSARLGACVSRGVARTPLFVETLGRSELTASEQQEAQRTITGWVQQCRTSGG